MVPDPVTLILLAHAAATWFMVGLIWFVQVVHYPMMRLLDSPEFARYARLHKQWTGRIVGPVMLIELATAVALVFIWRGAEDGSIMCLAGLALLCVLWASTFLIQMRIHARLGTGFDAFACSRLIRTNWIRTVAWSLRGVLSLALIEIHRH